MSTGCDTIDSKISDAQELTNTEKGNVTYINIYDILIYYLVKYPQFCKNKQMNDGYCNAEYLSV